MGGTFVFLVGVKALLQAVKKARKPINPQYPHPKLSQIHHQAKPFNISV